MREISHAQCVDAWMEQQATGLRAPELTQLLGCALGAIWERAHVTLGEVTLGAICHRVIFNAQRRFAAIVALELEPTPESFRKLASGGAPQIDGAKVALATRFILTELLTVLGNLTAEILTPALHAELSSTRLAEAQASAKSQPPRSASQSGAEKSRP